MMSRIEQLISEIEEYIDSCKFQALSNSKIVVNKEELEELLVELRLRIPDEIKKYQKIISQQDTILGEAQAQADAMLEDAKKQADAAGLCVADVVKVLAFDEAALTVDVQPITRYPDEDTFQTKPPVLAVPVATIYGGGFVIRPVYKAGDIGVVVYLDRDSDAVIAGGAEADPNTERLHSGDDAVFVGGIRTGGSSISGLPAGSLSLGTSDGGVYLSISPSGIDIKGNVTITGDLTVTGGVVNLN